MVKAKKKPHKTVKPTIQPLGASSVVQVLRDVTRGKSNRVSMTVRLDRDDWGRVHAFAVRQGTSMQRLFVEGLSNLMIENGQPPLARE